MAELKVALIGSAPSSVGLAPYGDPSWQIWGCSPGAYGVVPKGRSNVWWELHRYEPGQQWFSPEYCQFLKNHPRVMVGRKVPEIPNGEVLPVDYLVKKYSPYFFTSSVAWMMATAIEAGATRIGMWGIDMAATEEYEAQRSGLHFFAMIARQRGIEVGVPPQSDLFRPRFLYGIDEWTHHFVKIRARRSELDARLREAQMQFENTKQLMGFLQGAIDDAKYMADTWAEKTECLEPPLIGAPIAGERKFEEPGEIPNPVAIPKKRGRKRGNGSMRTVM